MDKRGYTIDPNRSAAKSPQWFETIGPSQRPSPYRTASWKYLQNYRTVLEGIPTDEIPTVFDNGDVMQTWLYPLVLDGGFLNLRSTLTGNEWDGGLIGNDNKPVVEVDHVFASVKVYDSLASHPGSFEDIELDLGELALDSDGKETIVEEIIDPNSLLVLDNGDNFQNPIPNPAAIYDGGSFAQWGQGEIIDGLNYEIVDDEQILINLIEVTLTDGDLIITNDQIAAQDGLEILVSSAAVPSDDDVPPGKWLGELNYEMRQCQIHITDWSHHNWMDDTPVRKAFKALMNSLPEGITSITVRDSPHAFWTSLGFVQIHKGDDILIYDDQAKIKPY